MRVVVPLLIAVVLFPVILAAQDSTWVSPQKVAVDYTEDGFKMTTPNNNFGLSLGGRLQFRFTTPSDQAPEVIGDFDQTPQPAFLINRARLKLGGHAYRPWLKFQIEYDVVSETLLDFRFMIEKWKGLKVKVGQWKAEYSMERMISSGNQQMLGRSILNRPLNIDRQQGVQLYGNLAGNGMLNFSYWATVLTGTGNSADFNDDEHLMYLGRLQWNLFGREFEYDGSDPGISELPAGMIAVAGVTNRGRFTQFSSDGGEQLPMFSMYTDVAADLALNQLNIETALKYRGFSWQSEVHHKEIIDYTVGGDITTLHGYYAQAGYFFHQLMPWWPAPLELAARHAGFYPDSFSGAALEQENSIAANWYFSGHRNKLTLEVSNFQYHYPVFGLRDGWRLRVQWDISF